jgi:hypothetical protein
VAGKKTGRPKPPRSRPSMPCGEVARFTSYIPALISVCNAAAFAASFSCSAAAMDAVMALVSLISWLI